MQTDGVPIEGEETPPGRAAPAPRSFERSASAPHTATLPVESGNSRVSAKQRATRAGPATELSGASRGPSESEAEAALARPVFFRADWGIGRVIGLSRLAERPLRQKSRSKAGDRRRRKTWRQRHFEAATDLRLEKTDLRPN